jgi:hypothetical protein
MQDLSFMCIIRVSAYQIERILPYPGSSPTAGARRFGLELRVPRLGKRRRADAGEERVSRVVVRLGGDGRVRLGQVGCAHVPRPFQRGPRQQYVILCCRAQDAPFERNA